MSLSGEGQLKVRGQVSEARGRRPSHMSVTHELGKPCNLSQASVSPPAKWSEVVLSSRLDPLAEEQLGQLHCVL